MQSKSISEYITFGTQLRYLADADTGWFLFGQDEMYYVLVNLEWFLNGLENFHLSVTLRAAWQIKTVESIIADRLMKEVKETVKGMRYKKKQKDTISKLYVFIEMRKWEIISGAIKADLLPSEICQYLKDARISKDEVEKLKKVAWDIQGTLYAEAEGRIAYIVSDKRIDVNKLLTDVSGLMAKDVFIVLPDIAQYDFIQAGKSLAFELPTAAAFHILRGTEAVLRGLYATLLPSGTASMWGPITTELRALPSPPDTPLLDNLDNIRRSFRNPTQHPEKIYDIDEVQNLFGLCVDVIDRMVKVAGWKPPV